MQSKNDLFKVLNNWKYGFLILFSKRKLIRPSQVIQVLVQMWNHDLCFKTFEILDAER